jgi:ribonuclease HI
MNDKKTFQTVDKPVLGERMREAGRAEPQAYSSVRADSSAAATKQAPDKTVLIYTDGACSGNPGKGGWGAVLVSGGRRMEIHGGELLTTNNRMELTAVIEALGKLKTTVSIEPVAEPFLGGQMRGATERRTGAYVEVREDSSTGATKQMPDKNKLCNRPVELFTDSKYVKDGITEWIGKWKMNGWKSSTRQPVKNKDLWIALDSLASRFDISWQWVKGHSGHKENERVDELARLGIQELK